MITFIVEYVLPHKGTPSWGFFLENSESFLPSPQKFLFLFCKHGLISEIYEQLVSAYSELCKTFKMELVTYFLFLNADDFCLI